jgi:hypothetical protein
MTVRFRVKIAGTPDFRLPFAAETRPSMNSTKGKRRTGASDSMKSTGAISSWWEAQAPHCARSYRARNSKLTGTMAIRNSLRSEGYT